MEGITMTIGQKIAVLREEKGWTQYRLAKEVRTHQATIGRIENGERQPSFDMVHRIAVCLGVSLAEFDAAR
jgi:UDP-N-acetylglucosamine 1-carboxyvinyltransferase